MATQTALALTEIGKPFTKIPLPIPTPKDNEILIKLTAVGCMFFSILLLLPFPFHKTYTNNPPVNPMDQVIRDNGSPRFTETLPIVLGYDVVGVVAALGPNLTPSTSFPLGAHIFSQALASGGLQEYTLVDSRYSAVIPAKITDLDAVVFPVNAVTSGMVLFSESGFGWGLPGTSKGEEAGSNWKGKKLVIVGGGTNTGKLAIQLARIAGVGTIIAIASLSGKQELEELGATHVVSRHETDEEIEKQVRDIVGDELVYVYDTFNGTPGLALAVSLLSNSKKGILARIIPGPPVDISSPAAANKKAGFEEKLVFGYSGAIPEFGTAFWKLLTSWLESGEMKVLKYGVIEGLDEEKVNKVLDEMRTRSGGRWHVKL
jgi:NADPH2:quinone reductase